MAVSVNKFFIRDDPDSRMRYVTIYWDGGYQVLAERCFANPTEFQIAADLLRNEDKVLWDDVAGQLYVEHGAPGTSRAPWTGGPTIVRCWLRGRPAEAAADEAREETAHLTG